MNRFLVITGTVLFVTQLASAKLIYSVDFEDAQIGHSVANNESVGQGRAETVAGGGYVPGGVQTVVANPNKDQYNLSEKALLCQTPANYHRSEFSSPRFPTVEKTYVYQWSYFMPTDFYTNCNIEYIFMADWKTWPCSDGDGWGNEICSGGGIYNDIQLNGQKFTWPFRWRAAPDCKEQNFTFELGKWYSFQEEIYWTNTQKGYQRLWMNGKIVREDTNFKTLLDRFNAGTCDIYWSLGFYGVWTGSKPLAGLYIDNLKIYDTSGVQGIIGEIKPGPAAVHEGKARRISLENSIVTASNHQGSGQTEIQITLPSARSVTVSLYSAQGVCAKVIATDTWMAAGKHSITIPSAGLASGLYFLSIISNQDKLIRQMMVY
jgi:hypothetical protein